MTTFQDAKDSFYVALRNQLAVLNPDRTTTVRGAVRPAVVVAENELQPGDGNPPLDTFVLHWFATAVDTSEAIPLEHARCEIRVSTAGSPEVAGMDRGRTLAAMRAELDVMLAPGQAVKTSHAGASAIEAATPVFWSTAAGEQVKETPGELRMLCAVEVFAWREP
ncbi:hypothetical protein [Terriglobus sp.]|uniref:hypothetical protein n=1 Tax=Terriglobus sp. TaxID=1889013 RepID=UPI003AFF6FFE